MTRRLPLAGQALQLARAGYGLALLLVPAPTIRLATGRRPTRRTCRAARLLGARHLAQTALTVAVPDPGTFTLGGQVDTVHAASMLLLAALSRPGRRPALADARVTPGAAPNRALSGTLAAPDPWRRWRIRPASCRPFPRHTGTDSSLV